ncbi:membrane protein [Gordonia phage Genamy16]|uniref:Membrane protein n=1 Tax=Gordonia phage Genamy16 TaxID=2926104 RepID=A0A9E7Q3P8_9CAUD|nr:membrane protein [Gordonia phage Genamy16]WNM65345.1 membrane protein [Gordonia phage Alyssamiracle]
MKQAAISALATTAVGSCIYLGISYGLGADPVFAANILLTLMCVFSWVFTFLYGFRSHWNLTGAGRTLMYLSLSFSLVLTQVMVSVWSHSEYPGREIIRFISYFVLTAALLNMVRRVLIEQALDDYDSD